MRTIIFHIASHSSEKWTGMCTNCEIYTTVISSCHDVTNTSVNRTAKDTIGLHQRGCPSPYYREKTPKLSVDGSGCESVSAYGSWMMGGGGGIFWGGGYYLRVRI
jgi:hypothetical protein